MRGIAIIAISMFDRTESASEDALTLVFSNLLFLSVYCTKMPYFHDDKS